MTTYPQASLRADRLAAIRGQGLPLAEGLKLEWDLTVPTAYDAGTTEGLERYDRGDRPAVPASYAVGTVRSHRSEEHTSELQSLAYLVCRLLLEKKKK